MGNTNDCVEAALEALKEKFGEDFQFEEGDEFMFQLNNCCLYIGLDDGTLSVKFLGGEPIKLDIGCDIFKEVE